MTITGNDHATLPAYADDTLAGLSPDQLVELLIRDEDRVPHNVIHRCAAHSDAMVERLRSGMKYKKCCLPKEQG